MSKNSIVIKGAREHNLKNVTLEIPREKFIVFTGISGSGKSSLAFDTLYAEGQRRYVESLSSYARQFLGQMEKPDVDTIEGLSPAISIDQKTTSKNPRSTVGTVTEIHDYLRLLYARVGVPHCPVCNKIIKQQTIDQIVDAILLIDDKTKIQILAPIVRGRKGEHVKELEAARKSGYVRVRIDGIIYDLSEEIKIEKNKKHDIEVVVDRIVIKNDMQSRLTDSLEIAFNLSEGLVIIDVIDGEELRFSQSYACEEHGISIEALEPRMFSFNNPYGACPKCTGLGMYSKVDPDLVVFNQELSLNQGAIKVSGWSASDGGALMSKLYFEGLAKHFKFSLDTPFNQLSEKVKNVIFYGSNGEKIKFKHASEYRSGTFDVEFEGIVNNLDRRYRDTNSDWMREEIRSTCMSEVVCPDCKGGRLKPEYLAVTVGDTNIEKFSSLAINEAIEFVDNLNFSPKEAKIANQIIKEISERLNFLSSVGLNYLTLSRSSGSLSGGESQRIRLATQIGSSLVGVLYILDEPSIGLHQRDNDRLLATLKRLRDLGNTLIVVEHDEDTMYAADYIVDIGPGAGVHGGEIIAAGDVEHIKACEESITGNYLSGKRAIAVPEKRREGNGKTVKIIDATENNLKKVSVEFPLGTLTCVTGVSGSGKSSLINEILYKQLANKLNRAKMHPGKHKDIEGIENLDKIIDIDQSPIGRTPRSNPATYTGVFNDVRALFAQTQDAKIKGYLQGRFSFNVKGGRCEACQGDGILKIEMHFLPDVYVPCEICKGKRYNRETLEILYKGKNIYDVLEMTIEEGEQFFSSIPKIKRRLQTLIDVGLSYVKIGQSAITLSGGEAQRVKLATELSKRSTGRTIYVLDEPTTGLHTADVHKLIEVLNEIVNAGNSVVVIEHNLDVIKTADYIIDLGPEGGKLGGEIVATGTPEEVCKVSKSYTGKYLKKYLENSKSK